jgi:diguanylate cyclase
VLRLVAKRLATAVRESDTVSRHGGDEFLILLSDISRATDVVQIATKLIAALARPARVGEHLLTLTASIGVSLFHRDGEDMDTLIERADAAMYRSKRGNGRFAFHQSTLPDQDRTTPPAAAAQQQPFSLYRAALAEQALRHSQLRDANQHLVLATLDAQGLHEEAEQAHRRQTDFLAVLARDLSSQQQATMLLDRACSDVSLLPRIQALIAGQVAHMSRLIGDLLDVSRD